MLSRLMMVDIAKRVKELHSVSTGYTGNAHTIPCFHTVTYDCDGDETLLDFLGTDRNIFGL